MALSLILQPSQHSDGHQHNPVAPTNKLVVLRLPLLRSQPIWWSQPKHVGITPLCWSSAYPCWNHSQTYDPKPTTVVHSQPGDPQPIPVAITANYLEVLSPPPVAITALWWSPAYLCCNNSHPGGPQPNPVVQPTPVAFWDNLLFLSLPLKQAHHSDGPQSISVATTVLGLSSAFCYRTHSRLDGSQLTPIATKATLVVVSITLKPFLAFWCPSNYPFSHKGTIVVHNRALWSAPGWSSAFFCSHNSTLTVLSLAI